MTKYLKDETLAIYAAYIRYQDALAKLQAECEHKVILENGYEECRRICEGCGHQEYSRWGSPYNWNKLGGRAYKVAYKEFADARPLQTYVPEQG